MNILGKLFRMIKPKTQREIEEEYFSKATDLSDLERRMRKVQNQNLRGWV